MLPLAQLCEINVGRTPSRSNAHYWGSGHPWLSIADMNQGRYLSTTKEQISEESAKVVMGPIVDPGTVALSFKLSIGKVGITQVPMYTNEAIATLPVKNPDLLTKDFLYWALRTINLTTETDDAVMGKTLNKQKLARIQLPVPPLREQRRIAEVLDRADALRAKRRQAISLLDHLTQSLFLDMFGDPLSNPKNWPLQPVEKLLATKLNYGTMIPAKNEMARLPCLRVANIQNWSMDLTDTKYVDLQEKEEERHTVIRGDIVMARAIASEAHLGKSIVIRSDMPMAFDSHLMRLRFNHSLARPEYIVHLLRSSGGRRMFLGASRRSNVQFNINTKEMSALRLPIPPICRQEAFASALAELEKATELQVAHLTQLDTLFTSLQSRAFRGELWQDDLDHLEGEGLS